MFRLILIQPITLILLLLFNHKALSQDPPNLTPQTQVLTTIPCLNSTPHCLNQLTQNAIANSRELTNLEAKLNLINQRLDLMAQRIDHANSRTWTNYLTLDPLRLIQNIFGGGDVQEDRLEIANLELSMAELEAVKGELERQKEEKQEQLETEVLQQLLAYESAVRSLNLASYQLATFNHQQEIQVISYRLGQGSTQDYLGSQLRGEQLANNLMSAENEVYERIRKVYELTGYEFNQQDFQWTSTNDRGSIGSLFPTVTESDQQLPTNQNPTN